MKKLKCREEQMAYVLRQVEGDTPVGEVCRKRAISEQTFYRWKANYAGMGVIELCKMHQLEDENRKIKQHVTDLWLDKRRLQEVLRIKA